MLIIGILTGVVLVLLFIVFRGNSVVVANFENKKQNNKKTTKPYEKKDKNTTNTTKTIYYKGKSNQYLVYQNDTLDNEKTEEKRKFEYQSIVIDLNTADTLDLQLVRGIGKVFAKRIYNYGKRLGGYHSKEQLREVYGINDTIFRKIASQITLQDSNVRKIDINTDNIKTLSNHPYIDYYLAKAIIQFR
ncbi:MAG: helix-hairpin-helix domain-containing protein, partial [Bacteroidota bacterium]|nr:helix-hairpin-helix domain-containing protein [Bacteroidota bacterium]